MDLRQALTTTSAVREFAPRPVPDDVVYDILDMARFAPSGGNRQAWRLILVKNPEKKRRLRDLYGTGWFEYRAISEAGLVPFAPITDRAKESEAKQHAAEIAASATPKDGFAQNFEEVPVVLALLANLRGLAAVDRDHDRYTMVGGASIYPFAWSILLAAHELGLGGVLTTMLVREEPAVLDLLEVPNGWALTTVIALGYPSGPRPTRLRRSQPEEFTKIDRFGGDPLLPG
jgi:nitroreductase